MILLFCSQLGHCFTATKQTIMGLRHEIRWKCFQFLMKMFWHLSYAPVSSLCQPKDNRNDSCALIKVTYVNSMSTVAHEIGHKIGIYHDREGCELHGVMSPVHEKPFHWTDCSNKDLDLFVANKTLSECLSQRSGQPLKGWDLNSNTFHSYSMDDQCSINFGPMYKVYQGPLLTKVCQSLQCIYDLVYPINAGAPLETTVCTNKTLKFVGKCVQGVCVW